MQGPRDLVRRCCFWTLAPALAATILAGCAGISDTFDVEPFLREQITGDTWRACLAREYQNQARVQLRIDENWGAATALASKGRDALSGLDVEPEPASTAALVAVRPQLEAARTKRSDNPCACAIVQGKYDGWAVTERRKLDTSAIRASFEKAASACATPR